MNTLEAPKQYAEKLTRFWAANKSAPYAKNWPLELRRHTNRHRSTRGFSWGWYEIHPLSLTVGHWGEDGDDLKGTDIASWNQQAAALVAELKATPETTK